MRSFQITKLFTVFIVVVGVLVAGSNVAFASSCVATNAGNLCTSYALSGVVLTADTVNGGAPFGIPPTRVMSGQFDWEYTPGDFANGNGTFTSLVLPWTYHGIGSLILAIDSRSLNGTLPGNFHSDGADFTIAMSPGLLGPTQGSGINYATSTFDIWGGGNEYVGHVTGGSIVVATVPVPAAAWLFGPGLFGLASIARKRKVV